MTVFWLMFCIPVLATLSPFRATSQLKRMSWVLVGVFFVYLIGLRYEVGGDWFNYLEHYQKIVGMNFLDALGTSDSGYATLNWVSVHFGLQVYAVNLVCAIIFMVGLSVFCRQQPLPWLALAVAVPYLIVVVAMGYTRQAAALGFLLLALVELKKTKQLRYVVLVLTAALFHKTAIFLLPMGLLISTKNRAFKSFAMVAMFALLLMTLLAEQYDVMWRNYVEARMASEGGAIRVWMNAVAAMAMLASRKYWNKRWSDTPLWQWLSFLALVLVPMVGFASTAVDRLAIYLIPLQLAVFSRLPVLIKDVRLRTLAVVGTLLAYGAVLWVWLNYGSHACYWLPYKNITLWFL